MIKYYVFIISLCVFVGFLVISCFGVIGTPFEKKALNLDKQRITAFERIHSLISIYTYTKPLPQSLSEVSNLNTDTNLKYLTDPETKKQYEYKILSENSYQLCTTFSIDSYKQDQYLVERLASTSRTYKKGYNCINFSITKRPSRSLNPSPAPINPGIQIQASTIKSSEVPYPNNPTDRDSYRKALLFEIQFFIDFYYFKFATTPKNFDTLQTAKLMWKLPSDFPYKITYLPGTDRKNYQLCIDFEIIKQKCIGPTTIVKDLN